MVRLVKKLFRMCALELEFETESDDGITRQESHEILEVPNPF